jgi:RNA polymerase sigma-70 factor (ECF subfamily)
VQKQTEADPLLSKRSVCHRSGMVSNLACNFLKHAVGLSENVTLWADAGGKIKQAALHPIRGRDAVARFSLGTVRFLPEDYQMEIAEVNGQAAVIIRTGSQALFVLSIEVEAERIQAIRIIANPEKLARL